MQGLLIPHKDQPSRGWWRYEGIFFPSPFSSSRVTCSYAWAPLDDGAYARIGRPYEGASARRTLRGTMDLKTCPGKWRFTSATTSLERLVRESNMVRITPRTFSSGN